MQGGIFTTVCSVSRRCNFVDGFLWVDSEFTGFKKDYTGKLVIMPKKEPKGKELTADAKAWNWIVGGFRVPVEHTI